MSTIALPGEVRLSSLPPLSLYIHIPWCVRKCPYCDFNSHTIRQDLPEAAYIEAVLRDLEMALPAIWGRPVVSVFIGGGTPSVFSPEAIDQLLSAVRARLPLQAGAEITLEANPGTVEQARLAGYRDAGITRVSLGIQSFSDAHLAALGRIHSREEAWRAVETAKALFPTFNLDLMYALPGQSLTQLQTDMETALGFAPPHLSVYHLTLEPNTLFHRYPPALPDDETSADMQEWLEQRLSAAGFEHYETSAYAQPSHRCRHNLNYWGFGDYLGIGAGAHSKISFPDRVVREMRYKQPAEYLAAVARGAAIQEQHRVPAGELPFEFLMNALRLTEGVDTHLLGERTGQPLPARAIERAIDQGLMDANPQLLRPTALGQRFLNDLLQIFLET